MKSMLYRLLSVVLLTALLSQAACRRMIDIDIRSKRYDGERITGALPLDSTEYVKIPLIPEPLTGGRVGFPVKSFVLPEQYLLPSDIGMPPVGDQGTVLGSCVGWAVGYAARSFIRRRETGIALKNMAGQPIETAVMSPSFVWNALNGGRNTGIWIHKAIDLIQNVGVCTRADMPYVYHDSVPPPNAQQIQQAAAFKIKSWGRIVITEKAFRTFLYHNNPIILQIRTDPNFRDSKGIFSPGFVWQTVAAEPPPANPTAAAMHHTHAVVLTGYDDTKKAFRLQNSWGTNWGDNGEVWMAYSMLPQVVEMAYVMNPGSRANAPAVVETDAFESLSTSQVKLKGTIKAVGDQAITKYGFLVGPDSTNLTVDTQGNAIEVPTVQTQLTALPYSFSSTYNLVQNQPSFYRAYATSLNGAPYYYYGKVIRLAGKSIDSVIPDEVEEAATSVSTADPHMTTFDGKRYDFMAVGEFVAAKSTTDNFQVQVRQEPYPGSTQVSVNTGIAMQIDNNRVCIYPGPGRLYVNNLPVTIPSAAYSLNGGGSIQNSGGRLSITNSNGDRVEVKLLNNDLDYFITPAKNRKGKLVGLFGNYDNNPNNDLVQADGKAIQETYTALYPAYADSWRVVQTASQNLSLFVYDVNKNTESYTDKNFPRSEVQLTAAQSSAAEAICRQAGVTDPDALKGCIVDVALTGNQGFAERAKQNEIISNAKSTLAVSNFGQYRNEFVLGSGAVLNGSSVVLNSKGTISWNDAYLNREGYETEIVLTVNAPTPCFPLFDIGVIDNQTAGNQNFLRLSANSGRTQIELVNSGISPKIHPANFFDGNRHRLRIVTTKGLSGGQTQVRLAIYIDNFEALFIDNTYPASSLVGYLYPSLKNETLSCSNGQVIIYGWSFKGK